MEYIQITKIVTKGRNIFKNVDVLLDNTLDIYFEKSKVIWFNINNLIVEDIVSDIYLL